jgi:hypothetical protein
MNPVKRLMSWLRGPTDPVSLVSTAEAQRMGACRDTIRISQNTQATQSGNPNPLLAPTPDVLDPGSEDSHNSR